MHHPWLGGSSVSPLLILFHQPCFENSSSSLATTLPSPVPIFPQFMCSGVGGGRHLSARGCAELSYSPGFLFPTSWVVLEPHLWARRGRPLVDRGETSYQPKSQSFRIPNLTKLKGEYYLGMRWVEPRAPHLVGKCCTTGLYTSNKDTYSPSMCLGPGH